MLTRRPRIAAKAALRRKKIHEHNLEQTLNHIGTIEQQMNAIESANINQETFLAMQRAGAAMKSIHGKLTPAKVDETMYEPRVITQPGMCTVEVVLTWLAGINSRSTT